MWVLFLKCWQCGLALPPKNLSLRPKAAWIPVYEGGCSLVDTRADRCSVWGPKLKLSAQLGTTWTCGLHVQWSTKKGQSLPGTSREVQTERVSKHPQKQDNLCADVLGYGYIDVYRNIQSIGSSESKLEQGKAKDSSFDKAPPPPVVGVHWRSLLCSQRVHTPLCPRVCLFSLNRFQETLETE